MQQTQSEVHIGERSRCSHHHHAFTIGYHAQLSTKLLIAVAGDTRDRMINKKKE
jgi:hypothetical protein